MPNLYPALPSPISLMHVASAVLLAILMALVLILWGDPRAPILAISGAGGAAIALYLVLRPLSALYVAIFLALMPMALRFGIVHDVAANSALALALGGWLLNIIVQRQHIQWNAVCVLMSLYLVWAVVTLLWAPDLILARKELVAYASGVILLLLISEQVRSISAIDGLMRVLMLMGWILILGGLHAVFEGSFQPGERLQVLGMNANHFGVALVLTLPGQIWPVLRSSGPNRAFHLVLSIFFILCTLGLVALSGSRGSSISLLLVLLAFFFYKPMRPFGILGIVLVVGIFAIAPLAMDVLVQRFEDREGGVLGGRILLWNASLRLVGDNLWTGVGIGNGPSELHQYVASLTSIYAHRPDLPSHNPLLEVAVDTGVLGVFLYASAVVLAVWQFFRYGSRFQTHNELVASYFPLVLGVSVGYFASWLKGGGMDADPTFFILLGLLVFPARLLASGRTC
ncbi:MAG: O-antigen ligase family protein [Mesorhizobium sp.]|uniref:O-antigen ligase family protein n=1 Tax=Mesorhizobium sp. TaxID=1871066 RepID=UPI0012138FBF|nr:O-antigen ligase family protein [Mesorhizobium sp.]TIL72623.1 MAG: O-antigen ligase family protein [Mesorhizobium sp.]TIL86793.1 MAG: O-antigen ligase family protein [Mesorhizobium sp.]TIL97450.1 MAG: O-antigen ligase family protein [Mesorhizobium sp.]